jgi:hypothetical protein
VWVVKVPSKGVVRSKDNEWYDKWDRGVSEADSISVVDLETVSKLLSRFIWQAQRKSTPVVAVGAFYPT